MKGRRGKHVAFVPSCSGGAEHLKRYVAEFDFRYNNRVALGVDDFERTMTALLGAKGKRLTYKPATGHGEGAV